MKLYKPVDKKILARQILEEVRKADWSARDLARKFKLKDPIVAMRILYKLVRKNKVRSYWRQYRDGTKHPAAESIYTWKKTMKIKIQ